MLLTMFALPSGEIITTLPSADSGSDTYYTPVDDATIHDIHRLGIITPAPDGSFKVEFIPAFLQDYNKSGFRTRVEAVEYEQNVLNKREFSEFLINFISK